MEGVVKSQHFHAAFQSQNGKFQLIINNRGAPERYVNFVNGRSVEDLIWSRFRPNDFRNSADIYGFSEGHKLDYIPKGGDKILIYFVEDNGETVIPKERALLLKAAEVAGSRRSMSSSTFGSFRQDFLVPPPRVYTGSYGGDSVKSQIDDDFFVAIFTLIESNSGVLRKKWSQSFDSEDPPTVEEAFVMMLKELHLNAECDIYAWADKVEHVEAIEPYEYVIRFVRGSDCPRPPKAICLPAMHTVSRPTSIPLQPHPFFSVSFTELQVQCFECREDLKWNCHKCFRIVRRFNDTKCSCNCGVYDLSSLRFYCAKMKKNCIPQRQRLEQLLIKEKRFYNIVLLGDSGVGKSTLINSIAVYVQNARLDQVELPLKVSIPLKFTIRGDTVELGHKDDNENVNDEGHSVTLSPKSYEFELDNQWFRIIDVPGINDTRKGQDSVNFDRTMSEVAQYKEIHAFCVLVKPNETRVNSAVENSWDFCLSVLQSRLGINVAENIFFCYTNCGLGRLRGDQGTKKVLKRFIQERGLRISTNDNRFFYFENMPFLYLCAKSIGINWNDDNLAEAFKESKMWVHRLLKAVTQTPPYSASKPTSNQAIQRARQLLPLAIDLLEKNKLEKKRIEDQSKVLRESEQPPYALVSQLPRGFTIDRLPINGSKQRICCLSAKCATYRRKAFSDDVQLAYEGTCTWMGRNLLYRKADKIESCPRCRCLWRSHQPLGFAVVVKEAENPLWEIGDLSEDLNSEESSCKSKIRELVARVGRETLPSRTFWTCIGPKPRIWRWRRCS
ncbi:hypothetical protein L596_009170 [Steinernema carpocapsae]|uniref:Uncharacterized protein n=1 Tax=Steinernema carpocapsae TaxID=34508 RepID=A0A4U5PFS9_STECR|nr:hypothetical protein L596_009170 [Steinernema carpocapsae]